MSHRAAPDGGIRPTCVAILLALWMGCLFVCPRAGALPLLQNSAAPPPPATSAATVPQAVASKPEENPVTLESGKTVDRDIAGQQSHPYQVTVPEGQCASFLLDQRGIDLAVDVLGDDGKVLITFDDEKRRTGEEKFSLPSAGTVRFNVRSVYYGSEPGRYDLKFVELRPATDADRNSYQVRLIDAQASRASSAGKYDDAIKLATDAQTLAEKTLPADDPVNGIVAMRLGAASRTKGDFAKADEQFKRAVENLTRSRGANDPLTARAICDQGLMLLSHADYPGAAAVFDNAIAITEQTLPADDPQVAQFLMDRATSYSSRGDRSDAMADLQLALASVRKYLEPNALDKIKVLYDIGDIQLDLEQYEESKKNLHESLAIAEARYGPDHPYCAYPLQDLGIIARRQGDYDLSLQYLWRSEKIREKSLGRRHPITAQLLVNIANVEHDKGDFTEELKLLLDALEIMDATSSPYNPNTLKTVANVARAYASLGDPLRAYEYQARVDKMAEKFISLNLATGSEREKLAFVEQLRNYNERSIWMSIEEAPSNQGAVDGAATTVLQRKAVVLDALAESVGTLRSHLKPEDQQLLDQLASTTADLAKLSLAGPRKTAPDEYQNQLHSLEQQREKLEAAISSRSNGYFEPADSATLAAVEEAIPADAVLIEYASYRPYRPKNIDDESEYGDPRYAAIVISHERPVRVVDLGLAEGIDAAVSAWRTALADPSRKDALPLARALDAKVMAPVRAQAGTPARLLISPAGDLNLIPFEALVDEHQKFLVERYSISYLTTGRDLLRLQNRRASHSAPLVVANPLFGESPSAPLVAQADARRSVTNADSLAQIYFAPLPATEQEAHAIQASFPNAQIVTGSAATKAALKQVDAPEILHIATHGFFLEDAADSSSTKVGDKSRSTSPAKTPTSSSLPAADARNPLLRAGLALSGANVTKDGNADGILTGLEAANLNLWGTKLVTLSACETGVGKVQGGEGVYGLRRAFFLAGTETLVMSLWEVSDRVTRDMMTSYYAGLHRGLGRGEALRQAELEMLKRKDRQHPFYWASFIQAGEWANLDGKR
jgi:CHAT domain-containing protein